jgi:hypothetical protein
LINRFYLNKGRSLFQLQQYVAANLMLSKERLEALSTVFIFPYYATKGGSTGVFCECKTLIPPPAFIVPDPGSYKQWGSPVRC